MNECNLKVDDTHDRTFSLPVHCCKIIVRRIHNRHKIHHLCAVDIGTVIIYIEPTAELYITLDAKRRKHFLFNNCSRNDSHFIMQTDSMAGLLFFFSSFARFICIKILCLFHPFMYRCDSVSHQFDLNDK